MKLKWFNFSNRTRLDDMSIKKVSMVDLHFPATNTSKEITKKQFCYSIKYEGSDSFEKLNAIS